MKIPQLELFVGAFVLAGLLAIAYLAVKIGGGVLLGPDTYTIKASFANSGGLAEGSSVDIAGVHVGRVHRVTLNSTFAAIVEMRLDENIRLPSDTIASIRTSGLIGDKFVSLSPGSETDVIPPGGTIVDTESAVDLESLISRFAFGSVDDKKRSPVK
jgi:phospholipid/cholesterol/gamma-HCH transport system substrate-binding protein